MPITVGLVPWNRHHGLSAWKSVVWQIVDGDVTDSHFLDGISSSWHCSKMPITVGLVPWNRHYGLSAWKSAVWQIVDKLSTAGDQAFALFRSQRMNFGPDIDLVPGLLHGAWMLLYPRSSLHWRHA